MTESIDVVINMPKKTIKNFIDELTPKYDDHIKPIVQIPAFLRASLEKEKLEQVQQQAMSQYRDAKIALEQSITDVATKDSGALDFASKLATRMLILTEIVAELGYIVDRGIYKAPEPARTEQLKKVGVSLKAIDARAPELLAEMTKKWAKTKVIGESGNDVEKGNISEAGFAGLSPLAIEHAATGNLRERMYITYKTDCNFSEQLFQHDNIVELINAKLKEKGYDWQINTEVIKELKTRTRERFGNLFLPGAYAQSREGSRLTHGEAYRRAFAKNSPTVHEMESSRIPLSERELLSQSGDLSRDADTRVQWLPGQAWSYVDKRHSSVRAAEETGDVMSTGISGTTDRVLTLGYLMGVFDGADKEKSMRDALVACVGWMSNEKDHTVHEILTSAKTFGLEYTAGPESYRQIKPGDDEFLEKLREAQGARGFDMPDAYLSAAHVEKLVEEIHPDKKAVATPPSSSSTENPGADKENIVPNPTKLDTSALKAKQRVIKEYLSSLRHDKSAHEEEQVVESAWKPGQDHLNHD